VAPAPMPSTTTAQTAADPIYGELAALFGALADPTRAHIVHLLLQHDLCTRDIATQLGVTDSAVSQHLAVLRTLRLVRSTRAGRFINHSLDDEHVSLLLRVGLTHLGHGDRAAQLESPSEVSL
jgi:ArsR family transcriptional regulator, lead/cadmium/zinc/bismuth-responsive transcriptional repressor